MQILRPNTGEDIVPVMTNHIFVYVTDYGFKAILKEIVIGPGHHHWEWIAFSSNKPVDITNIGNRFSTFDNALNRAVNDLYCTIYKFVDFDEVIREWGLIMYVDNIKTIYNI